MVPLSFGWGSAVLAAIATLAPSRAARSAIASPMPRLPPDTNSVLPLRDVMGSSVMGAQRVRDAQFVGTLAPCGGGWGEGLRHRDRPCEPLSLTLPRKG